MMRFIRVVGKLYCIRCLMICSVNECPDWLWRVIFRPEHYPPSSWERLRWRINDRKMAKATRS